MISKDEPGENRAKVKEHGLTFPVVLQQQWEISRRYAMFATPVACLINEAGAIRVGGPGCGEEAMHQALDFLTFGIIRAHDRRQSCMAQRCPIINQYRLRVPLYRTVAAVTFLLWLFMAAAEAWTPLHAWIHGGTIPEDDDCPIAAIQHGNVDVGVVSVSPVVVVGIAYVTGSEAWSSFVPSVRPPNVRGPPAARPAIAAASRP